MKRESSLLNEILTFSALVILSIILINFSFDMEKNNSTIFFTWNGVIVSLAYLIGAVRQITHNKYNNKGIKLELFKNKILRWSYIIALLVIYLYFWANFIFFNGENILIISFLIILILLLLPILEIINIFFKKTK